jgi:hypothetical protein
VSYIRLTNRLTMMALVFTVASLVAGAQTSGSPERYSATVVNEPGEGTTPIQINMQDADARWR